MDEISLEWPFSTRASTNGSFIATASVKRERIFIGRVSSDRKPKASREGSK